VRCHRSLWSCPKWPSTFREPRSVLRLTTPASANVEVAVKRRALWSVAVSVMVVVGALPGLAGPTSDEESHCVREVVGQRPDGELILSEARCYGSFMLAALDVSGGEVVLDHDATGGVLFDGGTEGSSLASFMLGIHFDGYNGSGSSISIVGTGCSGGWWNTGGSWANRISSSKNGCYRLTHHDYPNTGGASESTVGAGATHNLSSFMNNKTSRCRTGRANPTVSTVRRNDGLLFWSMTRRATPRSSRRR